MGVDGRRQEQTLKKGCRTYLRTRDGAVMNIFKYLHVYKRLQTHGKLSETGFKITSDLILLPSSFMSLAAVNKMPLPVNYSTFNVNHDQSSPFARKIRPNLVFPPLRSTRSLF